MRIRGGASGAEARAGALTLAFDHLRAVAALTEVFQDNHASQGVSRKLGYVHDGISRDARGSEALVSDRLRLTAEAWRARPPGPIEVTGVEQCLVDLGWAGRRPDHQSCSTSRSPAAVRAAPTHITANRATVTTGPASEASAPKRPEASRASPMTVLATAV